MPADIRNFFCGKTSIKPKHEASEQKNYNTRRNKIRKVVEDSDDEQTVKKTIAKAPLDNKAKNESHSIEEITASDYFASDTNPRVGNSVIAQVKDPKNTGLNQVLTCRENTVSHHPEKPNVEDLTYLNDDELADDIFAADFRSRDKVEDDTDPEILSDSKIKPKLKRTDSKSKINSTNKCIIKDADIKDAHCDQSLCDSNGKNEASNVTALKRSSRRKVQPNINSRLDNGDDVKQTMNPGKPSPSAPPKRSRDLKKIEPENTSVQAILDRISTVRAPTPPPKDPDSKWNWKAAQGGGNNGPPPAAGSKEVPVGEENCLSGLSFVFTGLLDTLAREEAQELVKRYGGKITITPSRKTSFVVLGNDAGPSKLRKIQELSLKTINEDGLFELIRVMPANGGDGRAAEQNAKKKKMELAKILKDAEEMGKEEERRTEEASRAAKIRANSQGSLAPSVCSIVDTSSQLWTTKYAPTSINQICGNKSAVEKIQSWLKGWPMAHKFNFQRKGPDGLGGYRAVIIHGPPGIGKTTAAHLAAKLTGYDVLESNASDTRSKKLVESGLSEVLNNNSLLGYFAGQGKKVDEQKRKIVLIMDEVDGMSAGDRGGVGALAQVCKKSDIPMILICNDRKLQKMKPFDFVTYDIPFRKPTVEQVRSRIATICHREGLKLTSNVIDALIEGSNKDIRQIINMISSAKLDQSSMDFDKGKEMTKAWEKHIVLKPWDICHKLLSGGLFSPSSKATLNDKIELYFNDHEFSYLMIQENYLSTKPTLAGDISVKNARLKALQLVDEAAQSISDGDLVDRVIHGSQQQWSLMPTHAVFSCVRPASFVAGLMTGRTAFTRWLGNNSKQQKLSRYIKDIQAHMRLRTASDRHEIRQQYVPSLWLETVNRLEKEGKDCVDEVIKLMDYYFLTKDDFDYIMELGVGPQDMEKVSIETQAKATFTRTYNASNHPLPFMKSSNAVAPAKIVKEVPDLEEAFEQEDDKELLATDQKDEDDNEAEIKKDKYIKKPSKKSAASKKISKKRSKPSSNFSEIGVADNSDNAVDQPPTKKKKTARKSNTAAKKKTT